MTEFSNRYPIREGKHCIEIMLNQEQQLYSVHDPAPFRERDLDDDAVEYILESLKEVGLNVPVRLVIHLPKEQIHPYTATSVSEAIHKFFSFEEELTRKKVGALLRQGRLFFFTGIFFLGGCLSASYRILSGADGVLPHILGEGLNIIGWVAMWKPIEIFLYDWRPLRRLRRYYRELSEIEIQVYPKG